MEIGNKRKKLADLQMLPGDNSKALASLITEIALEEEWDHDMSDPMICTYDESANIWKDRWIDNKTNEKIDLAEQIKEYLSNSCGKSLTTIECTLTIDRSNEICHEKVQNYS